MSIEEMIANGCTFDAAYEALTEQWEKAISAKEKESEKEARRKALVEAYLDYIDCIVDNADFDFESAAEDLLKSLEKLEKTIPKVVKMKKDASTLDDFLKRMKW